MKHTYLLFMLVIWPLFSSQGQTEPSSGQGYHYSKFVIGEKYLYGLDADGILHVWHLKTLEKKYTASHPEANYTALTKDRTRNIYRGTEKGAILKLDERDFSTEIFLELKKPVRISEIYFNSANRIFLIVPNAVYDPVSKKSWHKFVHAPNGLIVKKRYLLFFRKKTKKYFDMPQYSFMDSRDRLWMIKSFGEFGGSLQIFDTQKRAVIDSNFEGLDFGLFFPRSVYEDDQQNIYITSGLQHFMNSGEIYEIKNKSVSVIFDSEDYRDTIKTNAFTGGIFVGPGTYNEHDHKIYFATSEGFYCAMIPDTEEKLKPEFLFKPELLWSREPLAIGMDMAIKKLAFTPDNRLVFLTANNGIGVYDGKELRMIY